MNNKLKVYLTKEEVIMLTGIIGAMYGQGLGNLYDKLCNSLIEDDIEIAEEISQKLANLISIDEDNLLYNATIKVKGHYWSE